MFLKLRYASYLILVIVLLAGASWLALQLLTNKSYWFLALLAITIYFIMYLLGRVMVEIFVLLSLINHIKKSGGILSVDNCRTFVSNTLVKKSEEEKELIWQKVVAKLINSKNIIKVDGNLVMLHP